VFREFEIVSEIDKLNDKEVSFSEVSMEIGRHIAV
jgi:hypothetical protein